MDLILPPELVEQQRLQARKNLGIAIGLDGKHLRLKGKPLTQWQQFLDLVTAPNNPDNLTPQELYIHEAFRDLVQLVIQNQEPICKLLQTSTTSSNSTSSSK